MAACGWCQPVLRRIKQSSRVHWRESSGLSCKLTIALCIPFLEGTHYWQEDVVSDAVIQGGRSREARVEMPTYLGM